MGRVTRSLFVLVIVACSSDETSPSTSSTSSSSSSGGSSSSGSVAGTCDTDPLKTGIVAQQTGVSADAFDCEILKHAARLGEPDPMLFKAIMYGESRFDHLAAGCPNKPCGTPDGWTDAETGCYGLMQVVPACAGAITAPLLLPNGHPNLTKDASSPDWPGSVFNPDANISAGISGLADNRAQVKKQFAGCTEDQYTLMAVSNYASYGSAKSCTEVNKDYLDYMLPTYREYAQAAGYTAHPY